MRSESGDSLRVKDHNSSPGVDHSNKLRGQFLLGHEMRSKARDPFPSTKPTPEASIFVGTPGKAPGSRGSHGKGKFSRGHEMRSLPGEAEVTLFTKKIKV